MRHENGQFEKHWNGIPPLRVGWILIALIQLVWCLPVLLPCPQAKAAEATQETAAQARQLQLGGTLLQIHGDIEGAIRKYEESLALQPNEKLTNLVDQLKKHRAVDQGSKDAPGTAEGAGVELDILNQEVTDLYRAGKYDRGVVVAQKALQVAEQTVGPDHPDVATSLHNLAGLYLAQGDYAKAEPLHKRSLAIKEKALGPDHPDVAMGLNNLAWLYKTRLLVIWCGFDVYRDQIHTK